MSLAANPLTPALQQLMQRAEIPSFKALSQRAGVSLWQVKQLRSGQIERMRVAHLQGLAQALQVSVLELLRTFGAQAENLPPQETIKQETVKPDASLAQLQQEYQRLQTQLSQQRELLWQQFQQSSLQTLESWLIQWPTAAYAAQQNPQAPAVKLLPLVRPVEQLLQQWGISAIAPVGTELDYDPRLHQGMEGNPQPGDRVKVRYTGYTQGDKVLYRAKVSPISPSARP